MGKVITISKKFRFARLKVYGSWREEASYQSELTSGCFVIRNHYFLNFIKACCLSTMEDNLKLVFCAQVVEAYGDYESYNFVNVQPGFLQFEIFIVRTMSFKFRSYISFGRSLNSAESGLKFLEIISRIFKAAKVRHQNHNNFPPKTNVRRLLPREERHFFHFIFNKTMADLAHDWNRAMLSGRLLWLEDFTSKTIWEFGRWVNKSRAKIKHKIRRIHVLFHPPLQRDRRHHQTYANISVAFRTFL